MSGETPTIGLLADAGGMLERLVGGLATLNAAPMPRWALVGGLAVMVQLAEAHRATDDLDSAIDDDEGGINAAVAVLVDEGRAERLDAEHLQLNDGTKIDLIAVGAINPEDLPDLDDDNRWFTTSHTWAVDTARSCQLIVFADGGGPLVTTAAPIASPAALVAMKLQSHRARRRRSSKQASDVYDIYRLLSAHDQQHAVAAALATAPHGLAGRCAELLEETFVAGAGHWANQLHVHDRGGAMGQTTAEDLDVVGSLTAETLRRHLHGSPS